MAPSQTPPSGDRAPAPPGRVLITGAAGFIGSHACERFVREGMSVVGFDNFDPFYAESEKRRNLLPLEGRPGWTFVRGDIRDPADLDRVPDVDLIIHLAAKAGVRPSVADPAAYASTNVDGTIRVLELARRRGIRHVVFASSSSVYGVNPRVPWRESDLDLRPISPYAATKLAGEMLGHCYAHLHGLRFTALRFFTVFGPRQRPDLAIRKFAERMLRGEELPVFGDGGARRDFSYIDDVVEGVVRAVGRRGGEFEIINLGNDRTISVKEMIAQLEEHLGVAAQIKRLPEEPGDVPQTWAATDRASELLGEWQRTPFSTGIERFCAWLRSEHP